MQKYFYQNYKLGILGGGQLGRMLMQPCANYNVVTYVIDPDENAPCKGRCNYFEQGSITDFDSVYNFGKDKDLVTIEIENVNVAALKKLQSEGVKVYPQPEVIELIQDKSIQKQFYKSNNIPTADFVLIGSKGDIDQHLSFLPAFQKVSKGGYDGGGVQRLSDQKDLDLAFDSPGLLEKLVDFEKEISVIVARNEKGEISVFPPVELVFHPEYNLVDYLVSPAGLTEEQDKEASSIAKQVAEALGIVGILAVEMFLNKNGEILVNEVAPRPHNSGHQTIDANITSQYEQHLRAILGLPLGDTDIKIPSAMVNLLGEEGYSGPAIYQGIEEVLKLEGVNLYLYGKAMTKPHRKMGHITIVDHDITGLQEKVEFVKSTIKIIS